MGSEPIDSKLSSLNMAERGVTVVLRVKQSKFAFIFQEVIQESEGMIGKEFGAEGRSRTQEQMHEFFRETQIEMRLTVGSGWENQFFLCRAPFLNKFCEIDFKLRASESNFT